MAQAAQVVEAREPEVRPRRGPIDWWGGWRLTLIGPIGFIVLAFAFRIWQQFTAFGPGLEAASPEFGQTYRVLFYVEVLATGIATVAWWGTASWPARSAPASRLPRWACGCAPARRWPGPARSTAWRCSRS